MSENIILAAMFSFLKGEKPKIDTSEFHTPESYRGSEGPRFKILESKDDYEIRLYESSHWMNTSSNCSDYEKGSSSLFWRLFKYIRGENEGNNAIAMTIPVRVRVDLDDEGKSKTVTMGFYLPAAFQASPPVPTNQEVFYEKEEGCVMYAAHFGGFAKEKDWKENLEKLKAALDRDGKGYVQNTYSTAGHDPPYRLFGRHNEVLLVADPQPSLERDDTNENQEEVAK